MADGIFDVSDADVEHRIKRATGNSAPFVATKFGREYSVCDEDCAEFLSGAQFEIQYQQQAAREDAMRQMRDALQKAWIIFDGLRTYRSHDELLALLRSRRFEDTREAVRKAGALRVGRDA